MPLATPPLGHGALVGAEVFHVRVVRRDDVGGDDRLGERDDLVAATALRHGGDDALEVELFGLDVHGTSLMSFHYYYTTRSLSLGVYTHPLLAGIGKEYILRVLQK